MPTAYVQKMADKHNVSLETAERRWAEAKHAVKKGKRRGSWYWGKVMNTFKHMMGEEVNLSFKDFLALECDTAHRKLHVPDVRGMVDQPK